MELDADRREKAGRLPNPIIPFSYVTATEAFGVPCLPVYTPSPSCGAASRHRFASIYGDLDLVQLIRGLLQGDDYREQIDGLLEKATNLTRILASSKRSNDSFSPAQWERYADSVSTLAEHEAFLVSPGNRSAWRKRITIPVNPAIRSLLDASTILAISSGAHNIPICVIPSQNRADFVRVLCQLYGARLEPDIVSSLNDAGPLVLVWIAGFKPRGDDSRPDRGLLPLARMLFGPEADIMTIVYGPASHAAINQLKTAPSLLATGNGLWEAIIGLSDWVLADSPEATNPVAVITKSPIHHTPSSIPLIVPAENHDHRFSEQDVDSVLHLLFTAHESEGVFECLCNPPGGDWSGISLFDAASSTELRWTSLPRVTPIGQKRPDHVIQFLGADNLLLSIESKDVYAKLENGIGPRLTAYTTNLFTYAPNTARARTAAWDSHRGSVVEPLPVFSASAVCWTPGLDMGALLDKGKTDLAIAVQFNDDRGTVTLHMKAQRGRERLLSLIGELAVPFTGWLVVQVH